MRTVAAARGFSLFLVLNNDYNGNSNNRNDDSYPEVTCQEDFETFSYKLSVYLG